MHVILLIIWILAVLLLIAGSAIALWTWWTKRQSYTANAALDAEQLESERA